MVATIEPSQQALIRKLAWLSFGSGLFAIYRGHYDLCHVPVGVWLTSLLYWSHPVDGWRRRLDMGWAAFGVLYQSSWAISNADHANLPYFALLGLALACYPMGHYYHNRGNTWAGCYWHSGLHIFGNLSNVALYLGNKSQYDQ